jgi:hypothetical protein
VSWETCTSARRSVANQALGALRITLCTITFLILAISLHAQAHLSYQFAEPAKSADTERVVAISFQLSPEDDGRYFATYSRREPVGETLIDVKVVNFERTREVAATEAKAFFASLVDAGLRKLPKGDNFIGDASNSQIFATISGRDLQRTYNSPIKSGARKAIHDAVNAFAKKLGIDQPEDAEKATRIIEGNRTPAREVSFSSLITNPSRYDGKRIAVVGFYHGEFECSALVPEKFQWTTLDRDRPFWVDGSKFAKSSDLHWKNDSWVRIEGVFSARHGGHMGLAPGLIQRATKFEPLDGPPKPTAELVASEDDPHELEKLTLEIVIKPFPMDGRPIKEVVTALNEQIGGQLAERGLPADWLKIELDPSSNPKARIEMQPEKPTPLRHIIGMLGIRISPGEEPPFSADGSTYVYVLPNIIRLNVKTSHYPDDKEPISFHEDAFGKHPVRVRLARYADRWGGAETFRVDWHFGANPEELRVSEALDLVRRILPDEPGAKSITSIEIRGTDANWDWTAETSADPESSSRPGGVVRLDEDAGTIYGSPMSTFARRSYVAGLDGKTVRASPKWHYTGELPLELDAAIRAARAVLKGIPGAEDSLRLEHVWLGPLDASRCAYQITFRDPDDPGESFLTIPVLLSGKAIAPKLQAR